MGGQKAIKSIGLEKPCRSLRKLAHAAARPSAQVPLAEPLP